MSVQLQASQVIDRPVGKVFQFYADEHVRNHPRWDPDIHLENEVEAPLGIGSRLRRQNTRSGTLVEGSMQVVEFERDKAIGMLIYDGPREMRGRATFETVNGDKTRLTVILDIPGMEDSPASSALRDRLQRTLDNIKQLIESET